MSTYKYTKRRSEIWRARSTLVGCSICQILIDTICYRYRYFAKFPYRYRYRYFSKTSYRYRYFQNCLIDIDFDIDIFQNCFIDIDIFKNDHIDIAIDIDMDFLENIDIGMDFLENINIDIDKGIL